MAVSLGTPFWLPASVSVPSSASVPDRASGRPGEVQVARNRGRPRVLSQLGTDGRPQCNIPQGAASLPAGRPTPASLRRDPRARSAPYCHAGDTGPSRGAATAGSLTRRNSDSVNVCSELLRAVDSSVVILRLQAASALPACGGPSFLRQEPQTHRVRSRRARV